MAQEQDKERALGAAAEAIYALRHLDSADLPLEEAWPTEFAALRAALAAAPQSNAAPLEAAVRKLHAAKGRYHTQLACCDLYDLLGLPNVRPGQEPESQPNAALADGWLNPEDMAALARADECFEDGEGHGLPKARIDRLIEIGVMRHHGGGYYSITSFGGYLLGHFPSPRKPLETVSECNARSRQESRALPAPPTLNASKEGRNGHG